jgi:hypothetical protein
VLPLVVRTEPAAMAHVRRMAAIENRNIPVLADAWDP